MTERDPIFFITPDPVLGIGLMPENPDFHVVCLDNLPLVQLMRKEGQEVFCLKELSPNLDLPRTSRHLLGDPRTLDYIKSKTGSLKARLLFFKLNFDLERFFEKVGINFSYQVLNVPYSLARKYEDKIEFAQWAPVGYLPTSQIISLAELLNRYTVGDYGSGDVVQLASGHAGEHTFFIKSSADLSALRSFSHLSGLKVKISPYIKGETLTVNACTTPSEIVVSYPFKQLTGLPQLTPYLGGTCGTVWQADLVSGKVQNTIQGMSQAIGAKMREEGFLGWFGLDFLVEEESEKVYLIECNPRLTASVSMFTQLESLSHRPTLFSLHLDVLEGKSFNRKSLAEPQGCLQGSQITVRNTSHGLVQSVIQSGRYREDVFQNSAVYLKDLQDPIEVLILARGQGDQIPYGKEIMRIQSLGVESSVRNGMRFLHEE